MSELKYYAVFGNPVLHSKSPFLFKDGFQALDIAAEYLRIRPASAQNIIEIIKKFPLHGANITSPYKEDILDYLDELSSEAQSIGAVNTVVNQSGILKGYNTDIYGIINTLQEAEANVKDRQCLVLGSGGAAKAAVYALTKAGANTFITGRSKIKTQQIADRFNCSVMNWLQFDTKIKFDVIVSALLPKVDAPFCKELQFDFLLNASYKQSMFMKYAKYKNCKFINGERWLLHQAAETFKLFFNCDAPLKQMEKCLKKIKISKKINITPLYSFCAKQNFTQSDLIIFSNNEKNFQKIKNEEITKFI